MTIHHSMLRLTLILVLGGPAFCRADVRVKDITTVSGVRANQLVGMGLVTGLNGTGGKNPETRQFAVNMLQRFGLRADPTIRAQLRNDSKLKTASLSVVVVTADLPAFAKKGSTLDVTVSTFDDASSLQGGQLIMTPLMGVDGEVYAVASGPVSIGGFSFEGDAGSVQKNHPTTGRLAGGATVEKETCSPVGEDGFVSLLLLEPDYETASRIGQAINIVYPEAARVTDAGTVEVMVPIQHEGDVPTFLSLIGQMPVRPDIKAKVVINERTGTVVIGAKVKLSPVLITHANLAVITSEAPVVSQPAPFSEGETAIVPRTDLEVIEEKSPVTVIDETATVGDLARALNALGVTPRDLSSIFQQLKAAGALHAELEFK